MAAMDDPQYDEDADEDFVPGTEPRSPRAPTAPRVHDVRARHRCPPAADAKELAESGGLVVAAPVELIKTTGKAKRRADRMWAELNGGGAPGMNGMPKAKKQKKMPSLKALNKKAKAKKDAAKKKDKNAWKRKLGLAKKKKKAKTTKTQGAGQGAGDGKAQGGKTAAQSAVSEAAARAAKAAMATSTETPTVKFAGQTITPVCAPGAACPPHRIWGRRAHLTVSLPHRPSRRVAD